MWNEFKIQEQERWTHLTYIYSADKVKINYGYEDISELSSIEKQDKWEAEYKIINNVLIYYYTTN